jgi:hypothetical protein
MPGYLVPLMCGYQRISRLYEAGEVANVRDTTTPFAFTEAVYGVGEWRGLHRIADLQPFSGAIARLIQAITAQQCLLRMILYLTKTMISNKDITMAKAPVSVKTASVLAFERKLATSDAMMYAETGRRILATN